MGCRRAGRGDEDAARLIDPRDEHDFVGGGLGGLAAALFLRKTGHDVTVYEQAPELREVGAGIVVPQEFPEAAVTVFLGVLAAVTVFLRWQVVPL